MMGLLVRDARLLNPAASARGKVSHSWLDHEIGLVSDEIAVRRWRSREWNPIEARWKSLYAIARALGDQLSVFRASALVDVLPQFASLPEDCRAELRNRLDAAQPDLCGPKTRTEYMERLGALWDASLAFFLVVHEPQADEPAVAAAWKEVRARGERMKELFDGGGIPSGIVLP